METLALRDAFVRRDKRFELLDGGIRRAEWHGRRLELLEVGCADGGAAAHLKETEAFALWAVDIDAAAVQAAAADHPDCQFLCADACALPFPASRFDGIFSEAAFAVIPDKEKAASEYARVLRPGGRFLMNDFFLRADGNTTAGRRSGVPLFDGVRTLENYRDILGRAGMRCVYCREDYLAFLQIGNSLSKSYSVSKGQIGSFIRENFGSDPFVDDFFSQKQLSYAQLIFEKEME